MIFKVEMNTMWTTCSPNLTLSQPYPLTTTFVNFCFFVTVTFLKIHISMHFLALQCMYRYIYSFNNCYLIIPRLDGSHLAVVLISDSGWVGKCRYYMIISYFKYTFQCVHCTAKSTTLEWQ